jgi:hypothetical protein
LAKAWAARWPRCGFIVWLVRLSLLSLSLSLFPSPSLSIPPLLLLRPHPSIHPSIHPPLTPPHAAVFALPGYTLKGLEREFSRHRLTALQAEIYLIRLRQAWAEVQASDDEARRAVLERWEVLGKAVERG